MSERFEFHRRGEGHQNTQWGAQVHGQVDVCLVGGVGVGVYEWSCRPVSARATRRGHLTVLIKHIFADSGGTYGHRRVHAQLTRWGQGCSLELVRGLMRAAGLVACQPRPWRHSLTAGGDTG